MARRWPRRGAYRATSSLGANFHDTCNTISPGRAQPSRPCSHAGMGFAGFVGYLPCRRSRGFEDTVVDVSKPRLRIECILRTGSRGSAPPVSLVEVEASGPRASPKLDKQEIESQADSFPLDLDSSSPSQNPTEFESGQSNRGNPAYHLQEDDACNQASGEGSACRVHSRSVCSSSGPSLQKADSFCTRFAKCGKEFNSSLHPGPGAGGGGLASSLPRIASRDDSARCQNNHKNEQGPENQSRVKSCKIYETWDFYHDDVSDGGHECNQRIPPIHAVAPRRRPEVFHLSDDEDGDWTTTLTHRGVVHNKSCRRPPAGLRPSLELESSGLVPAWSPDPSNKTCRQTGWGHVFPWLVATFRCF